MTPMTLRFICTQDAAELAAYVTVDGDLQIMQTTLALQRYHRLLSPVRNCDGVVTSLYNMQSGTHSRHKFSRYHWGMEWFCITYLPGRTDQTVTYERFSVGVRNSQAFFTIRRIAVKAGFFRLRIRNTLAVIFTDLLQYCIKTSLK